LAYVEVAPNFRRSGHGCDSAQLDRNLAHVPLFFLRSCTIAVTGASRSRIVQKAPIRKV
jgi:hypothetical protein